MSGIGEQEYLRRDDILGFAPMEGKSVTWRKEGFARVKFNSYGMRDVERSLQKPAGTYRIAVIGDSYVESMQVDRRDTFCAQLEKDLTQVQNGKKVEVLNFGVSAYNLGQMMLRMENLALKFQPDMVLLVVRTHSTRQLPQNPNGGFFWARPSFFVGKDGRLQTDYVLQDRYLQSTEGKRAQLAAWIREHSRVWGVLSLCVEQSAAWWAKISKPDFNVAVAALKKTAFDQRDSTQRQNDLASRTQVGDSEKCALSVWPVADAIIRRMQQSCQSAGAKFCIVRLPGARGDTNQAESQLLADTAAKLSIPYCDTTAVLERAWQDGKGEQTWYIGHLAPLGHTLVTETLKPFVQRYSAETEQR